MFAGHIEVLYRPNVALGQDVVQPWCKRRPLARMYATVTYVIKIPAAP